MYRNTLRTSCHDKHLDGLQSNIVTREAPSTGTDGNVKSNAPCRRQIVVPMVDVAFRCLAITEALKLGGEYVVGTITVKGPVWFPGEHDENRNFTM